MSVYTRIHQQELQHFLKLYSLGSLVQFSGIQAGIENSNYRVTTTQGDFILTIFEFLTYQDLPQYIQLLKDLSQSNFPAPFPQESKTNQLINRLKEKPAALFNCLAGMSIEIPSLIQCAEIGGYLAKLHIRTKELSFYKENKMNLGGCLKLFNTIKPQLIQQDIELLNAEFLFQSRYTTLDLPKGIIHADLFKDNVLFNQNRMSGILDFYNACHDSFLFDIAVTCNDWCVENGKISEAKIVALLTAYQKVRPLNKVENKYLYVFLRRAALRFWLSRLDHQLAPKQSELTIEKDPLIFRKLLEFYRSTEILL